MNGDRMKKQHSKTGATVILSKEGKIQWCSSKFKITQVQGPER